MFVSPTWWGSWRDWLWPGQWTVTDEIKVTGPAILSISYWTVLWAKVNRLRSITCKSWTIANESLHWTAHVWILGELMEFSVGKFSLFDYIFVFNHKYAQRRISSCINYNSTLKRLGSIHHETCVERMNRKITSLDLEPTSLWKYLQFNLTLTPLQSR